MIKRPDILEIIQFKHPDVKLSMNLETYELIDNPDKFKMPSDKVLQQWAFEYDAYKLEEAEKKDNVLNGLAELVGVSLDGPAMTRDEIKTKIKEALQ